MQMLDVEGQTRYHYVQLLVLSILVAIRCEKEDQVRTKKGFICAQDMSTSVVCESNH